VAEAGLRRCLEGAQLVGLPVKGGKDQAARTSVTAEEQEDGDNGGWDAWVAGDDDAAPPDNASTGDTSSGEVALGLWEVEKRLFADNQSARGVLDELGLELLTETEARALLRRRVELSG
jgi:hypothetical protein